MNQICVIIGEGKSEKSFLQSLIVHQFDFEEMHGKNCIIFRNRANPALFWIFPAPSLGPTHHGGYRALQEKDVYMKSKMILTSLSYIYGSPVEFHYFIITDTDACDPTALADRETKMLAALDSAKGTHTSKRVSFAHKEIESWFIAGLTNEYPYLKTGSETLVSKLLSETPDDLISPKEILDSVLDENSSGNRERIGYDFGEHIDLDEAARRSPSFKNFIDELKKLKLLP